MIVMSPDLSADFQAVKDEVAAKAAATQTHVTTKSTETKNLVSSENDATQDILNGLGTGEDLNANTLSVNAHTSSKIDEVKQGLTTIQQGYNLYDVENNANTRRDAILTQMAASFNGTDLLSVYNTLAGQIESVRANVKGVNDMNLSTLATDNANQYLAVMAKSAIKSIQRLSFDNVSVVGATGYYDFAISAVDLNKAVLNVPFLNSPNLPNVNIKLPASNVVRITNSWAGGTIAVTGLIEVIEYV